MKTMMVESQIKLSVPATARHIETARDAAKYLTCDEESVKVEVSDGHPNWVVTSFVVPRARQIDVADKIMEDMSMDMEDYNGQELCFPKSEAEMLRDQRKLERAKERRRLARAANKPKP